MIRRIDKHTAAQMSLLVRTRNPNPNPNPNPNKHTAARISLRAPRAGGGLAAQGGRGWATFGARA